MAFVAPSDYSVADLSKWKVTLPVTELDYVGSGSSTSAMEVLPGGSPYDINGGYFDTDYFYYDTADDSIVFRTPLDGGATTPNTSYVRTELRELYGWVPGDNDGDANWPPTGNHVLSGQCKVEQYWEDDPQTVIGQIHAKDSSKALLKLQWDGPTNPVRAIINEDPSSGNPFSLTFGTPGTNTFNYTIQLQDGVLTITVDGVTHSVEFGQGNMSPDWNDHVYYFKAGSYPQASKNGGGLFLVRFYSINVLHGAAQPGSIAVDVFSGDYASPVRHNGSIDYKIMPSNWGTPVIQGTTTSDGTNPVVFSSTSLTPGNAYMVAIQKQNAGYWIVEDRTAS